VSVIEDVEIIDADTHVIEPYDLWTSRMPAKWRDRVPYVKWDTETDQECWFIGDRRMGGAAREAMAGWHEYPPDRPKRLSDVDPYNWDATARLAKMDEFGIQAQILYQNVALFHGAQLLDADDRMLQTDIIRAYNDWLSEWSSAAPDRLVPIASLPFWDVKQSIAEMGRCAEMGHRGVIFTQDPSAFGLPGLDDRHWDPLWAAVQEANLSINFHIGTGDVSLFTNSTLNPENGKHANFATVAPSFFMSNSRTILLLIMSGVCHRFPKLNFVSVESGIGWLPFFLESMDWQWQTSGAHLEHPDFMLPSEYFKRQIYACFWFERASARFALEALGDDNFLYETDFPHPTSMSPGPATIAVTPAEYIDGTFGDLPASTVRKIVHDNAARLYNLP